MYKVYNIESGTFIGDCEHDAPAIPVFKSNGFVAGFECSSDRALLVPEAEAYSLCKGGEYAMIKVD